jgi:hypothetical protein
MIQNKKLSNILFVTFLVLGLFVLEVSPIWGEDAKALIKEGDDLLERRAYAKAATRYYQAYEINPKDKKADYALYKTGLTLDEMASHLYEEADKVCYLNKRREDANPQCFKDFIKPYNQRFGEGTYYYWDDRILIFYSGNHFEKLLNEFPKSSYRAEASFKMFRGKDMFEGSPKKIIGRVESWIKGNKKNQLLPEAWLLLGRLYSDAWWVYAKHHFITEGGYARLEGIPEKAARNRGKGLAAFRKVFEKYEKSKEAPIARREFEILKNNKNDGVMYGISY